LIATVAVEEEPVLEAPGEPLPHPATSSGTVAAAAQATSRPRT
jgi:hypothetical protein